MADIFISYARDDRSKVAPIAKALGARAWSVWWDARIRSGETFDRKIEKPAGNQKVHPDLDAMADIPAGEFIYQNGKAAIEKHFLIDVYPVTNQQYEKFKKAGGYQNEQLWSRDGQTWLNAKKATEPKYWHQGKWNQSEHPAVGINYYEAEAFAGWAEKRLPTEVEWERASRGTDGREYPWGGDFDKKKCNTEESDFGTTTRVTDYPNGISAAGCYDIAGNVWEFTSSWYDDEQKFRVLRGGSWYNDQGDARCATRIELNPNERNLYFFP